MGPKHLPLATVICTSVISIICASRVCPIADEIAPCTCDGEGVNCWHAKDLDTIRRVLQVPFPDGAVRGVWIQGSSLPRIPANIFSKLKVQSLNLDSNEIEVIEADAFNGSQNTLKSLALFNNKLTDVLYSEIPKYKVLEVLNLGQNQLTTIPDDAFGPHPTLNKIILTFNKINHIGKRAFSGLPNLQAIELSFNALKTLGPLSLAMNSHAHGLQISIMNNSISSIHEHAFQGSVPVLLKLEGNKLTQLDEDAFLPLISTMAQRGGGYVFVNGNPFSCKGCDYEWLVFNKRPLQTIVAGLTCPDGSNFLDMEYDIDIEC